MKYVPDHVLDAPPKALAELPNFCIGKLPPPRGSAAAALARAPGAAARPKCSEPASAQANRGRRDEPLVHRAGPVSGDSAGGDEPAWKSASAGLGESVVAVMQPVLGMRCCEGFGPGVGPATVLMSSRGSGACL
jgi:hypothetical protein